MIYWLLQNIFTQARSGDASSLTESRHAPGANNRGVHPGNEEAVRSNSESTAGRLVLLDKIARPACHGRAMAKPIGGGAIKENTKEAA
jgi:hypothetical protein